jgi:hypothetical protein
MSTQLTATRLLAVIVVFERDLGQVLPWLFLRRSLIAAADRVGSTENCGLLLDQVLIYDNSLQARAKPSENLSNCIYVHDTGNGGTAAAYARACTLAREAGIDWLLLLDQDTTLPYGFLDAASAALMNSTRQPCALVPWVFQSVRVVSPARLTAVGSVVPLRYEATQPVARDLTAISSGSLLHVPTLASLMPLPDALWLDFVDHWIFAQLRIRQLHVAVFEASLQHSLSVFSLESLNLSRLTSILNGEAAFISVLGIGARLVYPFRFAARVIRYAWVRPELAMHMLAWIFHRNRRHM